MKNIVILAISAIPAVSFAAGKAFQTTVEADAAKGTVGIVFRTTQSFPSMCRLAVEEMKLKPVTTALNAARDNWDKLPGSIELTVGVAPNSRCAKAFGPHSGSSEFARGYTLPALADGEYDLVINGEAQGVVVVERDTVVLK